MNEYDKQKDLHRQLEASKNAMSNCSHDFDKTIYDPEMIKEGYGSVQDGAGSDPHWSYAGYTDVDKPRWSRKCKICGKVEYTHEQEIVLVQKEARFK